MRARLLSLSIALVTTAAVAQAQPIDRITVCRDGARFGTRDARACTDHRGVDVRATDLARQGLGGYANGASRRDAGQYRTDAGYRNHGQAVAAERHAENEARRDARRHNDQYGNAPYANGQYNTNGQYDTDGRGNRKHDDRKHDDRGRDDHKHDGRDQR